MTAAVLARTGAVHGTGVIALNRSLGECFHRYYDVLSDEVVCRIEGTVGGIGTVRMCTWWLLNS